MISEDSSVIEDVTLMKLRKKINEQSWSGNIENTLKKWCENSKNLRIMHDHSYGYYKNLSNRLYIPIVLCTSLSGVININIATDNVLHKTLLLYFMGSLNLLATFCTSLLKYYKPDENQQAHLFTSKALGSFHRALSVQLTRSKPDRQHCDDVLQWATEEIDKIQTEAPVIPRHIKKMNNNSLDSIL